MVESRLELQCACDKCLACKLSAIDAARACAVALATPYCLTMDDAQLSGRMTCARDIARTKGGSARDATSSLQQRACLRARVLRLLFFRQQVGAKVVERAAQRRLKGLGICARGGR